MRDPLIPASLSALRADVLPSAIPTALDRLSIPTLAASLSVSQRPLERLYPVQVGMTPHRDRAIRGYSKGMRQRTKIAQALVHDPSIIFLDEPLTGTDPVARRDLMDIILRLAGAGRSLLLSSHVVH